MKKFVALFNVNHKREYFKCFADTKEQAKKIALSTYVNYKRDEFIKDYEFVHIWEMEDIA